MSDKETKESIRQKLEDAMVEVNELGGVSAFKSGNWLLRLIGKSFRNYWERGSAEYFRGKYPGKDDEFIARKLTKIAANNTALIGAAAGAAVSANEISLIVTAGGGGLTLPVNIGVGVGSVLAEAVLLVRFQLKLVANLGKLYGVPLDPDDPEDILTILAYAVGGSTAEAAGKVGMKVGGKATEKAIRKYISKSVLEAIKQMGRKIGIKILQRTIIKYAVPVASIGIGSGWNYLATRAVGKTARAHFLKRREELRPLNAYGTVRSEGLDLKRKKSKRPTARLESAAKKKAPAKAKAKTKASRSGNSKGTSAGVRKQAAKQSDGEKKKTSVPRPKKPRVKKSTGTVPTPAKPRKKKVASTA